MIASIAAVIVGMSAVVVAGAFFWSGDQDAAKWVTPREQFTHPYSTRTKALLLGFLCWSIMWAPLLTVWLWGLDHPA